MQSLAYSREQVTWERGMAYQISLRQKIDGHLILNRLMLVALGKETMTVVELGAAKVLLGKLMPDLQAMAVSIDQNKPVSREDVDGLLLAAGLQPENEWSSVLNGGQAETVIEHDQNTDSPCTENQK